MTDPIKEKDLPDLKPGHKRLEKGKRVVTGRKVYTDQVPEELVRPKDPAKDKKGTTASTGPGNNSDAPKKAAEDKKDPGTPHGSGPAAPEKKSK